MSHVLTSTSQVLSLGAPLHSHPPHTTRQVNSIVVNMVNLEDAIESVYQFKTRIGKLQNDGSEDFDQEHPRQLRDPNPDAP